MCHEDYKTKEEIIALFEVRKQKNLDTILDQQYSTKIYGTRIDGSNKECLVKFKEGEIIGSPCSYCFEYTPLNPFRSGAFVFTACTECLKNPTIIENHRSGINDSTKVSRKARQAKIDSRSLKIDWDMFEKQMDNKQARLGLFAKQYQILPQEAKQLLLEKYGAKLTIQRGKRSLSWTT